MKILKAVFHLLFAAVWTAVLALTACLAILVRWDSGAAIWWARHVWSPGMMWIGGIDIEVSGRENVDPKRPTIYAVNHASSIDIPVSFIALPVNFRYVAKSQLRWVPILGWTLWIAKFVFVDRSNRAKAIASLEAAGRRIRNGISIVVHPEGTRSANGRILPFKKGPFALALKARVPICPVTIEGSARIMPKNSWFISSGKVKVKIGAPIDVTEYGEHERERLAHDVRAVIIRQSIELGGLGGDVDDAVAAAGVEGVGAPREPLRKTAS